MERQTLQQLVPVYHVCQQCAGAGCAVCADLCIVEGDIPESSLLDAEIQLDGDWNDEVSEVQA